MNKIGIFVVSSQFQKKKNCAVAKDCRQHGKMNQLPLEICLFHPVQVLAVVGIIQSAFLPIYSKVDVLKLVAMRHC